METVLRKVYLVQVEVVLDHSFKAFTEVLHCFDYVFNEHLQHRMRACEEFATNFTLCARVPALGLEELLLLFLHGRKSPVSPYQRVVVPLLIQYPVLVLNYKFDVVVELVVESVELRRQFLRNLEFLIQQFKTALFGLRGI